MRISATQSPGTRKYRGFTLTELLVALVAGLVAVSAVMVFAVSAIRSNAQIVGGARLLQQMRLPLDLIISEIRRTGYYADAARYVPADAQTDPSEMPLVRSTSCIVVRYDRNSKPAGEYRGYRYARKNEIGVIQVSTNRETAPDCNARLGEGSWRDLSDPSTMNVLDLSFAPVAGIGGCTSMNGFSVIVQDIDVRIRAKLIGSGDVVRELDQVVRARNDIMASGSCT